MNQKNMTSSELKPNQILTVNKIDVAVVTTG